MWKVLVKGESPKGRSQGIWEISICRIIEPSLELHPLGHPRNLHHEISWGWFSENKVPFSTVSEWMLRDMSQSQRREVLKTCKDAAQVLCDTWNANLKPEDDLI